jgi:predicted O-methyltransferase YrrM
MTPEEELYNAQANIAVGHALRLPGMSDFNKLRHLYDFTMREKPRLCVEIGVYAGRSLAPVALALKRLGDGEIFGIDNWSRETALEGGPDSVGKEHLDDPIWTQAGLTDAYVKFTRALQDLELSKCVRIIGANSRLVPGAFRHGTVDYIHIDANHSRQAVSDDVELYVPRLKPGGWLWMDDSDWPSLSDALYFVENQCNLVEDCKTYRIYRKK